MRPVKGSHHPILRSIHKCRNQFLPLITPSTERSDGTGPVIEVGALRRKLLVVTLGINHVVEQEALTVAIWGSASGTEWGTKPLLLFPRSVYATFLNLANYPAVRFLRVVEDPPFAQPKLSPHVRILCFLERVKFLG